MMTAPLPLFVLLGGLISIASGVAIRNLTHEKEVKKLKRDLTELYLTDEEKKLLGEIERAGSITQKELTDVTGYSRVKVHRILEKLESRRVVKRVPYGLTNKVVLETELFPKSVKERPQGTR